MKWFFASNEDYKEVTNIFLSSIKDDDCDLMQVNIDNFKNKWRVAGGREGDVMRKNLIDYAFSKTEKNELFVVCDTDIKFYKKVNQLIKEEIEDKDFIIQKEFFRRGCNMGFMAMLNNENCMNFWRRVYDISLGKQLWDQGVLNNVLYKEKIINWKRFSDKIWNWSMGRTKVPFNEQTCLHHANCAVTKENKIKQFEYVEECFKRGIKINFKVEFHRKSWKPSN